MSISIKILQFLSNYQPYIRVFVFTGLLILPFLSALADPADHGRYSDLDDDYTPSTFSIVIPLLILIGLAGIFLFFWLKDVWSKNKDSIQSVLGFIAIIAAVAFVGKCASENKQHSNGNSQHQYIQQPAQNSQINSIQHKNQTPAHTPQLKYRTEYYEERCELCYGSGHVSCDRCNGRGYIEYNCPECNGSGYRTVTKYNVEYNDPLDFLSGVKSRTPYTEEVPCFNCHVSGRTRSACPKCGVDNSYGSNLYSSTITCPSCKGQGILTKSRQVPYYE